jgi:alkanesulfonate monooxygenase SsuD/methylene tetrahydromethanopterin reductase-like flavin-dependent oxidoreductase (luciferase family)
MTATIDIGLNLPTRLSGAPLPVQRLLAMVELADRDDGWSSVWVGDSAIAIPFYDAVVLLSACAARTRRVRLGIGCMATIGLRNPLLLAQQLSNLDTLSGGRLTLVACPGWGSGEHVKRELTAFGVTHTEKVRQMEENVEFLRRVASEERPTFTGTIEVAELELLPGFVQRPFPVWFAANPSAAAPEVTVERLLGRVARLGDGWMTYAVTPAVLAERVARLRELRAELGHADDEQFPVSVFLYANVGRDEHRVLADVRAAWGRQSTREVGPDQLQGISAIGTPERCTEFIAELVEAGATSVVLDVLSEDRERQLEALSAELLPLLQGIETGPGASPALAAPVT